MNRELCSLLLSGVLLAGCAHNRSAQRDEESSSADESDMDSAMPPIAAVVQLVPSRLSPEDALERARAQVAAQGFAIPVTVRPTTDGAPPTSLALVTHVPEAPSCSGVTEVIQLGASERQKGSLVSFMCFTQQWSEPVKSDEPCEHKEVAGCPEAGDRVLAGVAMDAVSSL